MFEFLAHQLIFISNLGKYPPVIFSILTITVIFLILKKHYISSLVAFLTSISIFYSFFLKQLFKHSRPLHALPEHYMPFDPYGFPSTHVLFYTTFWGYIFYLTYKYVKGANLFSHVMRWTAVYMMVSVGASRIFLGVHYIKDVIAGYIFGLLFLVLLIWLDNKINEIFSKYKQKNQ